MAKFRVIEGEQVKYNGVIHTEGAVLEMSAGRGELTPWALEPVIEPKKVAKKKAASKKKK